MVRSIVGNYEERIGLEYLGVLLKVWQYFDDFDDTTKLNNLASDILWCESYTLRPGYI